MCWQAYFSLGLEGNSVVSSDWHRRHLQSWHLQCWEQDRPLQKPFHDGCGSCTSARLEQSPAGCEDGPSRAPSPW